jgi:hypothetical protein
MRNNYLIAYEEAKETFNVNMNRKGFLLLTSLVICAALPSFAQSVEGVVLDSASRGPMQFVNVVALSGSDSSYVSGTVTDSLGRFELAAGQPAVISISFIGYKTKRVVLESGSNLGAILLEPEAEALGGAVVTAMPYEFTGKGVLANVQNTLLSKVGNAVNVIDRMPLVYSKNGTLNVFGKGIPLIYIDGRKMRDAIELQQMNSSQIKSVEILTSPGPSYGAEVRSVILITTVRNAGDGLGGNINAGVTVDRMFSHNEGVSLNYRKKGLDIFGSFTYFDKKMKERQTMENVFELDSKNTEVSTAGYESNVGKRVLASVGFNGEINPRHSLGMKYIFSDLPQKDVYSLNAYSVSVNGTKSDSVRSENDTYGKTKYHYINAYYQGILTPKLSVKMDVDLSAGDGIDRTAVVNSTQKNGTENLSTSNSTDNSLFAGKLVFDAKIFGGSLSFGGDYSGTKFDEDYSVISTDFASSIVQSRNTSRQRIAAAFASYSGAWNAFSLDAGLRYENADFKYFRDGVENVEDSRAYDGLYPNITFSYQSAKGQTSLSFQSSTSRPSYYQYASSVRFNNEYMYESGNPYLKPTRHDELTYSLMAGGLIFMASFDFMHNQIINSNSLYGDKSVILYKPINVDRSQVLTVVGGYGLRLGQFQSDIQISMQKQFLKSGTPETTFNKPFFLGSMRNNYYISRDFALMLNLSGNTSGNTDISYYYSSYRVDIGLVKSFLKDRIRLNFMANDIFNTSNERWIMNINNTSTSKWSDLNTRGITFSITYLFNPTRSKYKGEKASNEFDRVSNGK